MLIVLGMSAFHVGVIAAVLYGSSVVRLHDGRWESLLHDCCWICIRFVKHTGPLCDYSDKLSGDPDLSILIQSRAYRLLLIFGFAAACDGLAHYCLSSAISG